MSYDNASRKTVHECRREAAEWYSRVRFDGFQVADDQASVLAVAQFWATMATTAPPFPEYTIEPNRVAG